MTQRVFGGGRGEPVTKGDVEELIRLVNQKAQAERLLAALARNVMQRLDASGGLAALGPHEARVERERVNGRAVVALEINGMRVWEQAE